MPTALGPSLEAMIPVKRFNDKAKSKINAGTRTQEQFSVSGFIQDACVILSITADYRHIFFSERDELRLGRACECFKIGVHDGRE